MIRYLANNQIDIQRWDDCIAQSPNGNVYCWSWYLDVTHPGWEALVEDDYETVMPLAGGKKYGINYLFQPFFTQKFGVCSKKEIKETKIKEFLAAIPSKFKYADFRIEGCNSFDDIKDIKTVSHRNIELDLKPEYAILTENYNSNTKRNLAKAKKEENKILENTEPTVIIDLFRKNRGQDIKHWGDKEYERLSRLVTTAERHGKCMVLGVQDPRNQIVTGAFFMISHNKIVFLFSGSDKSNKENHALSFLIDHVIKKYSGTGNILDFEGSDDQGLARFYKGFGGRETTYKGILLNRTRGLTKLALKIFKKL